MVKSLDEVEDLTRFADESFDTDTIDLFEFTGNDNSPLTRLKSIILSLDWEITDDILDELIEEVANLRTMWEGDKVAQVYLQGLDKVGKYLKVEGAYAHHNAIKLLLTLFYNYEKIISSPDISGDTITSLLKSDIRKFKVLQYQIGMKGDSLVGSAGQVSDTNEQQGTTASDDEQLNALEAAILGLDWEVTDEGLAQFNSQAKILNEHLSDNTHAQVLVQGLQAIGAYISEQKVKAHPDAFTLLHTFFDGLKPLITDNDLDSDKRQEIVIERVSLLNSLKEIIAGNVTPEPVQTSDDVVNQILDLEDQEHEEEPDTEAIDFSADEAAEVVVDTTESTDVDDELDIIFESDELIAEQPAGGEQEPEEDAVASLTGEDEFDIDFDVQETADHVNAAMETADEQYPDEILDPAAIQPLSDEIADEFIEEELSISSKWQPDIDESDEAGLALEPEDTPLSEEELDDELELLFVDEDETKKMAAGIDAADDHEFDELALEFDEDGTVEEESDSNTLEMAEATADEEQEDEDTLDFGDDLFLSDDDEDLSPTDEESPVTPALADSDEEIGFAEEVESVEIGEKQSAELEDKLDSFFGLSEDDQPDAVISDVEQASVVDELLAPALADAPEDGGFREEVASAGIGDEPSAELEDKLDSFFEISEEEPDIGQQPESAATVESDNEATDDTVVAALADESFDGGFHEEEVIATLTEDPSDDLQDKLDSFFGGDDEPQAETVTEDSTTPLDEELDSFFTEDETQVTDQESDETMPALADADERSGFDEEEAVTGLAGSAMDEIDDKLDSFFDIDKEDSEQQSATPMAIVSTLAAAAAALPSAPAAADLQQVADLVAVNKEQNPGTNHTVLLTLIDSAVGLLAKKHEIAEGSSAIVQELVSRLEDADNSTVLIEAVNRYTSWQQAFFDTIISSQEEAATEAPSSAPKVADEEAMGQIESGFSQLRGTLMDEFDSIRKELKKE